MRSQEYEGEILRRFESGEIYDSTKMKVPDSLRFTTHSGRVVFGGGGIIPDVFMPRDTIYDTDLIGELSAAGIFRQFSFDYAGIERIRNQFPSSDKFVSGFEVDGVLLTEFGTFAENKIGKLHQQDYSRSLPLIRNLLKAYIGKKLFNDPGFIPVLHQQDKVLMEALRQLPGAAMLEHGGK